MKSKIIFLFILLLSSCDGAKKKSDFTAYWKPSLVPIKFSYSSSTGLSFSTDFEINIPYLGEFGIEYSYRLKDERKTQKNGQIISIGEYNIKKQDLVVIIRDKKTNKDNYYNIPNGAELEVLVEGRTSIKVQYGVVIIDITHSLNLEVFFKGDLTKGEEKEEIEENLFLGEWRIIKTELSDLTLDHSFGEKLIVNKENIRYYEFNDKYSLRTIPYYSKGSESNELLFIFYNNEIIKGKVYFIDKNNIRIFFGPNRFVMYLSKE